MAKRAIKKTTKKAPAKKASAKKAARAKPAPKARATKVPAQKTARAKKPPAPVVLETEVIEMPDVPAVTQPPAAPMSGGDPLAFALGAAQLCRDDHCEDVLVLDVRTLSSVADYIVIASGTSDRQMRSVLRHVEELGQSIGSPPFRTSSDERATWLIADFVDVVVHLFEPGTRSHYDLEMLWGDAPRVAWERPDQIERDRAGLASN